MDTSKHFFQLHGVDAAERPVLRRKLRRERATRVVPAKAGTHMWTAPVPQEFFRRSDRIACVHMSGLLMRYFGPLAKMVSATRAPNNHTTFLWPMGPTDCLAPRIDRSYHLFSSCSSGSAGAANRRPADLLSGGTMHPRAVVTLARRH